MKHFRCLIALMLLVVPISSWGQQEEDDEALAARIVAGHYAIMNYDAIRQDSMLFVETVITTPSHRDTLTMYRWLVRPLCFRVELWHKDTLKTCYYTDGKKHYRRYIDTLGFWETIHQEVYYFEATAYDFRGPLYEWQKKGFELRYGGEVTFEGHKADRILSVHEHQYDRQYFFDHDNHLLFLYTETDNMNGEPMIITRQDRVDWHAYHEYSPVGFSFFISQESYQLNEAIMLLFSKASYRPIDLSIFERDKR